MRYNLATLAELRVFEPCRTRSTWTGSGSARRDARRGRQRTVVTAAGCGCAEGALLDDGLLDVVVIKPISKLGVPAGLPAAVQGHPRRRIRRTSITGSRRVTVAAPGIVAYADGERLGPLPVTVRVRPGSPDGLLVPSR